MFVLFNAWDYLSLGFDSRSSKNDHRDTPPVWGKRNRPRGLPELIDEQKGILDR